MPSKHLAIGWLAGGRIHNYTPVWYRNFKILSPMRWRWKKWQSTQELQSSTQRDYLLLPTAILKKDLSIFILVAGVTLTNTKMAMVKVLKERSSACSVPWLCGITCTLPPSKLTKPPYNLQGRPLPLVAVTAHLSPIVDLLAFGARLLLNIRMSCVHV